MKRKKSSHVNAKGNTAITWMKVLPTVSAYVRSMILNYHDSEDIIQNIAVVFAEKFDLLESSRDVVPWVLRITRYEVINHFRTQDRLSQFFDERAMERIEAAYQSVQNESEQIKTALHACIKKLHERPRRILELRYFREMSVADISRHLGISSNAIYIMLCRVREALAKCVQSETKIEWKTP